MFTMNRKLFYTIYLILSINTLSAQAKWPAVKYTYAKAYMYNLTGNLSGNHKIIKNGKLDTTVTDNGKLINVKHLKILEKLFTQNFYILSNGISNCYIPRHAIVYYDDNNNAVASLSVCFTCQAIRFYYPVKKDKPVKYTKKTEDIAVTQLETIKKIFLETGYPVFNNSEEYINYNNNK